MIEARLAKHKILNDGAGGTLLVGVFEYDDEFANFKVPYRWDDISNNREAFSLALRDSIAEVFDIPIYNVDMGDDRFFDTMLRFDLMDKGFVC